MFGFASARAQEVVLMTPASAGRLTLATPAGWTMSSVALEEGSRPVMTLSEAETGLTASYSVFQSRAEKPTAEVCREEELVAMKARYKGDVTLREPQRATQKTTDGMMLATASFVLASADEAAPAGADQTEFLAFAAGPESCAEMDLSLAPARPFASSLVAGPLALLHFEPAYRPTADDLAALGALFADQMNDPVAAAVYTRRALEVLPADASVRDRRQLTNTLIDELVELQDLGGARQVATKALTSDPKYALYAYDLACLDAEENNAAGAEAHLQQAFDHRTEMLPGETLPDPRLDDSLQKLKGDKRFWKFVERLG